MIPGIQHRCIFLLIVAGWLATGKASTCNETLVDTVTDDKLTASSSFNDWCPAEKSRLSSSNGWRPNTDNNSWIQVDFEQPLTVKAIVTKGSENANRYVMKYVVKYSNTTSSWITLNGTSKEFTANSDTTTPVINNLPDPIVARYIRLYPTECSEYCILRFDVIGCGASECSKNMVDNVTDDKLTASSSFLGNANIRLTTPEAKLSNTGWCPIQNDHVPWIQVNFGRHIAIKGVVSMGSATHDAYVKEYRVNYSSTTSSWKTVVDAEFQLHTFRANEDSTTPVTNYLPSPIVARFVRLLPTGFNFHICLRFDVIGCEDGCIWPQRADSCSYCCSVTTPTSTTLAVPSSTTSTQSTLTTVNRQTTTTTLPKRTTTKFLSSPTTTMTLPSLLTSATSGTSTSTTTLSSQDTTTTANTPTSPTTLYLPTTATTSGTSTSTTTLSSQDTTTTANTPTSPTTLYPPTTATTSGTSTSTTTLSSRDTSTTANTPTSPTTLYPPTTATTSGTSTSTTTLSSQNTSTTANTQTSPTTLYSPTTSTTSSTPTSTTTLSSQDTSTTANTPTSPTTLYPPTTATTSGTSTSNTALSSQDTTTTVNTPTSPTTLYSPTTSTTSSTPTSTTTLSSQDTSTTANTPTSPTTLYPPTTATTSGTSTSNTALSSQDTTTTVNTPTSPTTLYSPTTASTSGTSTSTTTLSLAASPTTSTAVGATQRAVTTFKPALFNSTQVGFCTCICTETNDSMTPQKVQARLETIVQNLTVSKKKTSKYLRSKTSAQDSRPEVVYVGSVAIVILCMFASLIVLPDLYTLLRFIYAKLKCKEK